ncbi:hypothetical protein VRK_25690 [Vibrio sp. MEBiC08052]|nr:hypothetical protein VRK_25690 [Vibrio sp. MEBiC08052]
MIDFRSSITLTFTHDFDLIMGDTQQQFKLTGIHHVATIESSERHPHDTKAS